MKKDIISLEEFVNLNNNILSFNKLLYSKYDRHGYEITMKAIKDIDAKNQLNIFKYLNEKITAYNLFILHKEHLLKWGLKYDFENMNKWVLEMSTQLYTKSEIYKVLSEYFVFVQYFKDTKYNDELYDFLADFLDCFLDSSVGYKILPEESI